MQKKAVVWNAFLNSVKDVVKKYIIENVCVANYFMRKYLYIKKKV